MTVDEYHKIMALRAESTVLRKLYSAGVKSWMSDAQQALFKQVKRAVRRSKTGFGESALIDDLRCEVKLWRQYQDEYAIQHLTDDSAVLMSVMMVVDHTNALEDK